MRIREWLKTSTSEEQTALAVKLDTSVAYLRQLACQHRRASWRLAVELEEASKKITPDRVISKTMLRPDIAKAFSESR